MSTSPLPSNGNGHKPKRIYTRRDKISKLSPLPLSDFSPRDLKRLHALELECLEWAWKYQTIHHTSDIQGDPLLRIIPRPPLPEDLAPMKPYTGPKLSPESRPTVYEKDVYGC